MSIDIELRLLNYQEVMNQLKNIQSYLRVGFTGAFENFFNTADAGRRRIKQYIPHWALPFFTARMNVEELMYRTDTASNRIGGAMKRMSGYFRGAAYSVTWLSMSMLGLYFQSRYLEQYITQPIRQAIGEFDNWQKMIDSVAEAFVNVGVSGMDFNYITSDMGSIMEKLFFTSLKVSGAMSGLKLITLLLQDAFLSGLTPSIEKVLKKLGAFVIPKGLEETKEGVEETTETTEKKEKKPSILKTLEDIGKGFGKGLEDVTEALLSPETITNTINAINQALGLMATFFGNLLSIGGSILGLIPGLNEIGGLFGSLGAQANAAAAATGPEGLGQKLSVLISIFTVLAPIVAVFMAVLGTLIAPLLLVGMLFGALGNILTTGPIVWAGIKGFFTGLYLELLRLAGGISKTVIPAFQSFAAFMMANPVIAILAVVAAVVALITYLYFTNEEVRKFIDGIRDAIVGGLKWLGEQIGGFISWLSTGLGALWEFITGTIMSGITAVVGFVQGGVDLMVQGWESLKNWLSSISEAIVNGLKNVWSGLVGFFEWLWNSIVGAFQWAYNIIKPIVDSIMWFASQVQSAISWISGGFAQVQRAASETYDELIGHSILPDLYSGVSKYAELIGEELGGISAPELAAPGVGLPGVVGGGNVNIDAINIYVSGSMTPDLIPEIRRNIADEFRRLTRMGY